MQVRARRATGAANQRDQLACLDFVAGGDKIELLDGGPIPERLIIIEFPDIETARRWYRSDEYQAALKVRLSTSHGRVFLIEGVEPAMRPAWPRPESEA